MAKDRTADRQQFRVGGLPYCPFLEVSNLTRAGEMQAALRAAGRTILTRYELTNWMESCEDSSVEGVDEGDYDDDEL